MGVQEYVMAYGNDVNLCIHKHLIDVITLSCG